MSSHVGNVSYTLGPVSEICLWASSLGNKHCHGEEVTVLEAKLTSHCIYHKEKIQ